MKNNDQHIENIIGKILSGESVTAAEQDALQLWLSQSEENKKYFEHLQLIFNDSNSLKSKKPVNTDRAWEKMQQKMKDVEPEQPSKVIRINPFMQHSPFMKIAAMLILVAGIAFLLYRINNNSAGSTQVIASYDKTKTVKLPDSSSVFLNKNSSVTYSYSGKKRIATLKGEAYFDVVHDEEKPFIVNADDLEIKDIGTAFNIKIDSIKKIIEVTVESGEVAITTPDKTTTLNLVKGEKSVYDQTTKTLTKSAVQSNDLAYKTKVFVFENASLEVAIQKLNEVYGTNIKLSEEIKSCHITSTFKNEKIGSILDIIAETLHLKMTKKDNEILLEGNACEE